MKATKGPDNVYAVDLLLTRIRHT
uniref:Uncharacterized protein n=1 Tax=Arundo donax TaxID=35708 RepID=A0A0A9BV71_ARUDO